MKKRISNLLVLISFYATAQVSVNDTCLFNRFNPGLTNFAFANTTTTQITYGTITNTSIARVYTPLGDVNTCRPLILWAHGGGFVAGDYLEQKTTDMMRQFARKGYVAVAMRYRLTSPAPTSTLQFQEALIKGVQDMIAAIRYIRANANLFGIDTSQIFIGGSSAGAIIANHTAFMDLNEAFPTALANQGGNYNVTTSPTYSNIPYNIAGCVTQAGALWDLTFLNNETSPWGAVHNTSDPTVSYNTGGGSQQIYTQLQSQNVKSFLKTTNSPNLHTPFPLTPTAPYVDTFNLATYRQLFAMLKHQSSASVTVNNSTLTASQAGQSYQWFLNNVAIPTATNVVYVAATSGNYFVQVRNCATCFSSSQTVSITLLPTSIINQESEGNNLTLFPQPATDRIHLQSTNAIRNYMIYNSQGQKIIESQPNSDKASIDINDFGNGIYFIQLIYNDNSYLIEKFVKN